MTLNEISLVAQIQSFHQMKKKASLNSLNVSQPPNSLIVASILSELQQVPHRRPLPPSKTLEDESSAGESGDEYVQERKTPKPKRRVKSRRDDDDDERRRIAQRKRKRKAIVEQDLSELPPDQGVLFLSFF
jgi:hypothetical protein